MKLTYKYIWKGFTMVRLDEKSDMVTKVKEWQTVESDRNPKYFLEAEFVAVDLESQADIEYAAQRLEAEKKLASLNWDNVSKLAKVTVDVAAMELPELREELNKRGIKFNSNCGKATLAKKLSEAILAESNEETEGAAEAGAEADASNADATESEADTSNADATESEADASNADAEGAETTTEESKTTEENL